MKPIIEVKNIYKKYQIGLSEPYYSLRDTLVAMFSNPFKILKRTKAGKDGLLEDEFWALKNISFEVYPGEVIGIIGRNGAGKTTLLKILSRITPPTKGKARLGGRVASLLEVGTGFHPELTGRENIYLNGAILGMSGKEVKRKFDEIVKFAEIERFLDTPIKHFSSGMYMRLAFSVAAHLDAEILIIDEVLAVGDAAFQMKCLGKMKTISQSGRTVLFVSHNMSAVRKLCSKGIFLKEGKASKMMNIDKLITGYQYTRTTDSSNTRITIPGKGLEFYNFGINGMPISKTPEIFPDGILIISLSYSSFSSVHYDLCLSFALRKKADDTLLFYTHNHLENVHHKTGKSGQVELKLSIPHVAPGEYTLEMQIWLDGRLVMDGREVGDVIIMPIPAFSSNQTFSNFPAQLLLRSAWEFKSS